MNSEGGIKLHPLYESHSNFAQTLGSNELESQNTNFINENYESSSNNNNRIRGSAETIYNLNIPGGFLEPPTYLNSVPISSSSYSLLPSSNSLKSSLFSVNSSSNDKMRRESHKEVERRRREVINVGIAEMAKIVPNCSDRNKGGILQRAVQYIHQLKEAECSNAERWTLDKVLADQAINELTSVIECLKSENESLRSQIVQLGGEAPPRTQIPSSSSSVSGYHPLAAAMQAGYHHYFPGSLHQNHQNNNHHHHQISHWSSPMQQNYPNLQLSQPQDGIDHHNNQLPVQSTTALDQSSISSCNRLSNGLIDSQSADPGDLFDN